MIVLLLLIIFTIFISINYFKVGEMTLATRFQKGILDYIKHPNS